MRLVKESDAKAKAREHLAESLSGLLANQTPVLLLISGGSWLEVLEGLSLSGNLSNLTVGMLDDRYVRDEENNFFNLTNTNFYNDYKLKDVEFISSLPMDHEWSRNQEEGAEAMAIRLEYEWKLWREYYPHGEILACVGMGQDGHVMGVFPDQDKDKFNLQFVDNTNDWTLSYKMEKEQRFRVTATLAFLRAQVKEIVFYAEGDEKKKALEGALANVSYHEVPASFIADLDKATLFTSLDLETGGV